MDRDPRPIIASLGIEILEIPSLLDRAGLFAAYGEAFDLAQAGHATLIYPTGFGGEGQAPVTIDDFGRMYGIVDETRKFAADHKVPLDTKIWIPGSLMSFRDVHGDAPVPVLRERSARRRGAPRRRHEGARSRSGAREPHAGADAGGDRGARRGCGREPKRTVVTTARPATGHRRT